MKQLRNKVLIRSSGILTGREKAYELHSITPILSSRPDTTKKLVSRRVCHNCKAFQPVPDRTDVEQLVLQGLFAQCLLQLFLLHIEVVDELKQPSQLVSLWMRGL